MVFPVKRYKTLTNLTVKILKVGYECDILYNVRGSGLWTEPVVS